LPFENEGKAFNYSIANVHAPTETSDEEENGFFDALERADDTSPECYTKIALSNFSAQVGKETVNFSTTGKYSLHNLMNDNGSWLIWFAVMQNMFKGSMFYPHTDIYQSTWKSPDGVTFIQIDHLITDRRHEYNLLDVRSN
jgi:hypothetical protein